MNKRNLKRLRDTKGFVFDMDGTLVLGDTHNKGLQPLPGAVEMLQHLHALSVPYVVMTNGTIRTPGEYAPKLSALGFPVDESIMLTPSSVAADYFVQHKFKRIMVLGNEGVWRPLTDAGLEVVPSTTQDPGPVDAIYIGWYREFGFADMEAACNAVWQGARLFSASDAPFFAAANGRGIGTSCAIAAAIKAITGKRAKVLGKPSMEALRCAAGRMNVNVKELAVVGDDPDIEITMAHRGGAMAIYVHTGTGGRDGFGKLHKEKHPHLSLNGAGELLELYGG